MNALRDVTVGIPVCDDDPGVLSLVLDALAAERLPHPPVIVDTSSTERIAALLRARRDAVRYERLRDSTGVSASRNRIVELTDTRYLLSLDADAVPAPGWGVALRRAFDEDERAALVGARIVPVWPRTAPPGFRTTLALELLGMLDLGDEPGELPRVMGTSYALDLERLPGRPFRPELGRRPGRLLSWEEVQLSLDVIATGWRIRYEPRAVVRHHVRTERVSWRWMLRRAYAAGQERCLSPTRLEPFPRRLGARDRAFQAVTAPAFLAGRLRGPAAGP